MTRTRRRLLRLFLITGGVVAVVWTIRSLDPGAVWRVAMGANPAWLAASSLPIVLRFLVWGIKWKRMLAREAYVPLAPATRIIAAGSFINLTVPTAKLGGGVLRAVLLNRRYGWRLSRAYGWAFADQVTNLLGHALLFGVGMLVFSGHPAAGSLARAFAVLGGLTLLAFAVAIGIRHPFWIWIQRPSVSAKVGQFVPRRFVRGDGVTPGMMQRIFGPLLQDGASWGAFTHDVLMGAVAFTTLPIANAMVLRALDVQVPLMVVTVVVVLGYLAGNLLGPWGGIGVTEAALTALGTYFGVPAEAAAAGALLHRAVYYAVVLGCGGPAWWLERRVSAELGTVPPPPAGTADR